MKSLTLALWAVSLAGLSAEPLLTKSDFSDCKFTGPKECWTLADGVLTGKNVPDKKGSILWTTASFHDFTLEGEFKFSGEIDSGIFLRQETDQIQIGVSRSLKRDMTGSPYISKTKNYPAEADTKGVLKDGEWNSFRIVAKGNRYVVSLNGKQVLDYVSETAVNDGPIGFQMHPGVEMQIEFRKLDVKPEADVK